MLPSLILIAPLPSLTTALLSRILPPLNPHPFMPTYLFSSSHPSRRLRWPFLQEAFFDSPCWLCDPLLYCLKHSHDFYFHLNIHGSQTPVFSFVLFVGLGLMVSWPSCINWEYISQLIRKLDISWFKQTGLNLAHISRNLEVSGYWHSFNGSVMSRPASRLLSSFFEEVQ